MGQHVRRTAGVLSRRGVTALVGAATFGLGLAVAVPVARADDPPPPSGSIGPIPIPIPPIPQIPLFPSPEKPTPARCSNASQPFVPKQVTIPGIAEGVAVVALHRDAARHPGVPPLTTAGKAEMAFDLDSGIRPGARQGNALFNAHTWPDGSALGNRLLAELHPGDRILVYGKTGRQCYRVTDRIEVPASDKGKRYYATTGDPHFALAVCSGKRLGAGVWTKRTLWFATPVP